MRNIGGQLCCVPIVAKQHCAEGVGEVDAEHRSSGGSTRQRSYVKATLPVGHFEIIFHNLQVQW